MLDSGWRNDMNEEMTDLHANETWELTFLPLQNQIIGLLMDI